MGQNDALILHEVLGAMVPLSGTTENGSNTFHWNFVTRSLIKRSRKLKGN